MIGQDLRELPAKWREPRIDDECTLYTLGKRTGRREAAADLEAALTAAQGDGAQGKGPLPQGAVAWLDMGKGEAELQFGKKTSSNRANKRQIMELFDKVTPGYHPLYLHPQTCLASSTPPQGDIPAHVRSIKIPTGTMEQEFQSHYRRGYEAGKAASSTPPQGAWFDFAAYLQHQREWSEKTFGPGARTAGVVDHIRKELREIEADPTDLMEWIDVVILALDGAWRCGGSPEEIIAMIVAKQAKNEGRTWPDWRTAAPDKAIEHDRAQDAQPAPVTEGDRIAMQNEAFDIAESMTAPVTGAMTGADVVIRERDCTDEAARKFYAEGWNECLAALSPAAPDRYSEGYSDGVVAARATPRAQPAPVTDAIAWMLHATDARDRIATTDAHVAKTWIAAGYNVTALSPPAPVTDALKGTIKRLVTLGDSLPKSTQWDDYRLALVDAMNALSPAAQRVDALIAEMFSDDDPEYRLSLKLVLGAGLYSRLLTAANAAQDVQS